MYICMIKKLVESTYTGCKQNPWKRQTAGHMEKERLRRLDWISISQVSNPKS
jgi:hypothetical protein